MGRQNALHFGKVPDPDSRIDHGRMLSRGGRDKGRSGHRPGRGETVYGSVEMLFPVGRAGTRLYILICARRATTGREGGDERARSGDAVSSAENTGIRRLHGIRIDNKGIAAGNLHLGGSEAVYLARLPDSRDDRIAVDDEIGPLLGNGPSAAGSVGFPEGHADALDPCDAAVEATILTGLTRV